MTTSRTLKPRTHTSPLRSVRRVRLQLAMAAALAVGMTSAFAEYSPPLGGLVAWWRADGNGNDSADSHHGTLKGGTQFASGLYGQAFDFGPSGNRVYVPDSPDFKLTSSLSIAAFVYPRLNSHTILQRGDNRSGLDPYSFSQGLGNLSFQITGSATQWDTLQCGSIPLNAWSHVTATLDGDTGSMRLYVNGVLANEKTTSVRPFADLDPGQVPGIGIGNCPDLHLFPFVGLIDEVLLYSRALSPTEVASLVPEPAGGSLLLAGLAGFVLHRCRCRKPGKASR